MKIVWTEPAVEDLRELHAYNSQRLRNVCYWIRGTNHLNGRTTG
jgi:hypothetical protein